MRLEDLSPGMKVHVITNRIVQEMYDHPPVCTTGIVLEPAGDGLVWIEQDIVGGQTLLQMMGPDDIVGLAMVQPGTVVETDEYGNITARVPLR